MRIAGVTGGILAGATDLCGRMVGLLLRAADPVSGALGPLSDSSGARASVAELRAPATDSPAPQRRTLLLEGETGARPIGIFLVENAGADSVLAPLRISAFSDGTGREATPIAAFSPNEVHLNPGEQVVVQVAVVLDERFEPDIRYLAEISIPGLTDSKVPIAARRYLVAAS